MADGTTRSACGVYAGLRAGGRQDPALTLLPEPCGHMKPPPSREKEVFLGLQKHVTEGRFSPFRDIMTLLISLQMPIAPEYSISIHP